MALTGLLHAFAADPALRRTLELAREADPGAVDITAPGGVRPVLAAALSEARPLLLVTATGREADDLAAGLAAFTDPGGVAVFPAWETLPHERLSPRSDTVGRRLAVLRRLAHPDRTSGAAPGTGPVRIVVAPVRAVLQPVVGGLGDLEPVALHRGTTRSLDEVAAALVAAAYTRVDMVERRGEFAVRGGILDVFPPTDKRPSRIEFFGDEVDEIRHFAVADQRSLAPTDAEPAPDSVWAPPCREILLTDEVRARARALAPQLPGAREMLERISEGHAVEGMESLAPVLVDSMVPLVGLLDPATLVLSCDPERVRRRAADLVATSQEFLDAAWSSAAAGAETPLDLSASSFATLADTRASAASAGLPWWTVTPFGADEELADEDGDTRVLRLGARDPREYHGDVPALLADVKGHLAEGWGVVVVTGGPGPLSRLGTVLAEQDVPARTVPTLEENPEPGVALLTCAPLGHGFVSDGLHLVLLTEADVYGKTPRSGGTGDMRRLPARRRNAVDPLQLRPGDFVVHDQHGVGRFVEMLQRTVGTGANRTTREYLVIEYASSKRGQPGDRLYVPSDSLDQVTRYVGGDEPKVNKLGGSDWAKTKSRARKAVKQIAGELVRLYAARTTARGFAFSPDTPWQRELEEAFPYVETPDQLTSIEEVKADMEKPLPMDRLISGDVGYGKTEIAVRAAFKAVQDGKQVVVLVPTTLLVQQHFETFTERFSGFPVTVRSLSRFQGAKESAETIRGLADGTVDVVIGTHRLLTGEVRFKDLGLVVVDEEQRFGVEHKETLKQLRANVDVLSMSATPIPRTLEMAVTGIREMSTLATPPEERHPVLTYVGPYDNRQVAAAVRRELLREGQVFFIHNRVRDIDQTAARIRELVPEARVEIAHGQMNEGQLERVIVDFWEKRFDVLVCTTIVETGLDISNANTLIVDRADHFGLSQLHQLRGRVGRGRERAYAYFLYPGDKPLTETAHDRLETIAAHTDLGAGMEVALKDLEIRGAGNLLGGEQSGHIEGVGFDLYVRMVGEAVAEYKGEKDTERKEVKIELPVDAHLPHEYIAEERLRLEAYQKLANADTDEAVDDVMAELRDRYGEPPEPVVNLAAVARFRAFARAAGLTDVAVMGRNVRFAPVELLDSQVMRLKRLYPGSTIKPAVRQILVPFPATARIGGQPLRGRPLLDWARGLVEAVLRPQAAPVS